MKLINIFSVNIDEMGIIKIIKTNVIALFFKSTNHLEETLKKKELEDSIF
jgi:hypothetical protein